jgi:hypothetical protein
MVKDLLALLVSVIGITGVVFCALQGGWWVLGMLPAGALCYASAVQAIHARRVADTEAVITALRHDRLTRDE